MELQVKEEDQDENQVGKRWDRAQRWKVSTNSICKTHLDHQRMTKWSLLEPFSFKTSPEDI